MGRRYEPPLVNGRSDIAAEMTLIRSELMDALKKRVERRRREKERAKAKRKGQSISPVQKKSSDGGEEGGCCGTGTGNGTGNGNDGVAAAVG